MIVVPEPSEVVEGGHFQVWTVESLWQLLSDGIENANPRLLFDTFRENFLGSSGPLLRRGLIPRFACMHGAFLIAAHMEQRSRLRSLHHHSELGLRALRFLRNTPILSFVQDIGLRFLHLPRGNQRHPERFLTGLFDRLHP